MIGRWMVAAAVMIGGTMVLTQGAWAQGASAQGVQPLSPGISVAHGWTRLTTVHGKTTPAYMTVHNAGPTPDTLVSTSCPIAHHTLLLDKSGTTLGGVVIKPGETLVLSPAGTHLMLQQNRFRFYAHAMIPCSVNFLGAGRMIVYLHVEPADATGYQQARRPIVNN